MGGRILLVGTVLIATVGAATSAQDRFVRRTPAGSRIGIGCTIHDYTGREIIFQTKPGGPVLRVPRRDVVDVSTHYLAPHVEARKLLDSGRSQDAFVKFNEALDQEHRAWVRREILATQVKCALWTGDYAAASERFLAIIESDPDSLYFPLMPLAWSEEPPAEATSRAARNWMTQTDSSAALLLGASHLLTEKSHTEAAKQALKNLARDGHAEIQRFAQMQLWRDRVLTEDVTRDELFRWERTMEDAGDALGGGPRYILGLGWKNRHDDLSAAAAWLWLPLVSSDDCWLAARASWNAAQALERAGATAEALSVLSEIGIRYADTPIAATAETARRRLVGAGNK